MGLLSLLNFYCCRYGEHALGRVRLLSLLNFYCCRYVGYLLEEEDY